MKKLLFLCFTLCISTTVFAADQVVKEETTPPPAEGALTPNQLKPLMISVNQNPMQPQAQEQAQPQGQAQPATQNKQ